MNVILQRLRKLKKMEKKKRKALENEAAKESALTDRSKKRKLNAEASNVDMVTESGTNPRHIEAIRREDEHFKLLDPEKEKRTIFVGNLPSSLKEKEIKKMFQVRKYFIKMKIYILKGLCSNF